MMTIFPPVSFKHVFESPIGTYVIPPCPGPKLVSGKSPAMKELDQAIRVGPDEYAMIIIFL